MRTTPSLALAFLISSTMAVPAAHAQQAGWDGDWEGTWQCAANANMAAFTLPAIATISRGRIKLSRATANNDEILNGTIDGSGAVVLTGRGVGPDGQPLLSSFNGTVSGRSLTANGRIVPQGGGAVQPCALAMAPAGTAGPTVLRGSGYPDATSSPYPAPTYYPPPVVYSDPYWYDDDYYWRRYRWDRWRRTHGQDAGGGGHAKRPLCPAGQMPSGGRCRVISDAPPPTPPSKPIGGGSTVSPPPPPPSVPDKRFPTTAAPAPSTVPSYTPPSYTPSSPAPTVRDKYVPSYSPPPASSPSVVRPAAPPPPPPSYSPPPVKYSSPPPAPSPAPAPSYSPPEKSYSSPAPAPSPARSAPPPPPPPPASSGCSGPKCPR